MSLKTKCLLRDICKFVYFTGAGNHWCEDIYSETLSYRMYTVISFSIYSIMVFLENLAALFGNFPKVEKNSAFMFSAVHSIVLVKMFLFLYHKTSIRKLNYEMAAVGEKFEKHFVMKKLHRKAKMGILMFVISVYMSLITYGVESARKLFVEDAPFYTVVTFYPRYDDHSYFASFLRVFFYITWLYMMLPMMSADCMPITHLVALTYKFVTLREHFEGIKKEFDEDLLTMNRKMGYQKLKSGILEGIRMHQTLLRLTDEIHRVFGIIMSLQVCESSAVAVLLLLRLALTPGHMNVTNAFMTYTFVGSLFLLLALNLWNAGEVTYQASLLSNAMFFCGWHMCEPERPAHKDVRQLVLIGCAQAQKPLILKAFGIQDLSYATFVSVARATYSVFAVFYQRREK